MRHPVTLDKAHKWVSTVGTPIVLAVLGWVCLQFVDMRDSLRDIKKTVEIELPHLKQADQHADGRITRLEGWIFGRDR